MNERGRTVTPAGDGPRRRVPQSAGLAGTSFKHEHLSAILADSVKNDFFEVHAENYMGAGGPAHRALETIRNIYPLSIHGVCMSIGGSEPLNVQHLQRFRDVVARYEPILVSEHLAWCTHAGQFFNDLLPLPYTPDTLARVCEHIDQMQEAIRRPILLENPSTYVAFDSSTMGETEFIGAVTHRTGCRLLLDLNNVFVSATNQGYCADAYLAGFPLDRVDEIHLAGHAEQRDDEEALLLIDSHDRAVDDAVWALYEQVVASTGPIATLIEWDSSLPAWEVLRGEAQAARRRMMGTLLKGHP
ncbi:DUF692 domain-containing protein [Paraburkholderia jirisanensis]